MQTLVQRVLGRSRPRSFHSATADDWRTYCQEVGEAAEQLRTIALRAEMAAENCASDGDMMRSIARDIGLALPHTAKRETFAAMMLGPFTALELLRQRLRA